MNVSADLSEYHDKADEDSSLEEIRKATVTALAGVTDEDAEHLNAVFNIKTVADLGGPNRCFTAARAMFAPTQ